MASPVSEPTISNLTLRIISGVVLGSVVIGATWYGYPAFHLAVFVLGGLMAWEWGMIVGEGRLGLAGYGLCIIVGGALIFSMLGMDGWGVLVALVAAPTLFVVNVGELGWRRALWLAAGGTYCALPAVSLLWLRQDGAFVVFWVLFLVWATDIGAYAVGRTVGGPKMAPMISPGKTWSGLAGGIACAAAIGWTASLFGSGSHSPWMLAILSGVFAIVAQLGDLLESAVKRQFGIKDSSNIIPGHGGVLDRVDGLVPVAIGIAVLKAWGAEGMIP